MFDAGQFFFRANVLNQLQYNYSWYIEPNEDLKVITRLKQVIKPDIKGLPMPLYIFLPQNLRYYSRTNNLIVE